MSNEMFLGDLCHLCVRKVCSSDNRKIVSSSDLSSSQYSSTRVAKSWANSTAFGLLSVDKILRGFRD